MESENLHHFNKSIEYKKGENLVLDLVDNKPMKVRTSEGNFSFEKIDGEIFVNGDAEWCKEPVKVKLFSISQNGPALSLPTEIIPDHVEKGYSLVILRPDTGEELSCGTIEDFDKLDPFNSLTD